MDPRLRTDEQIVAVLERGQQRGFLGSGDVRVHIRHARAHGEAAKPLAGERWCDLGSGGGVPGLVMALDRPDVEFVLLDRSVRRAEFLLNALQQLALNDSVRVACGDAAELAHRAEHRQLYDGVVSRAFGTPAAVAECASGLVRPEGRLIVSEPPSPAPAGEASAYTAFHIDTAVSPGFSLVRWPAEPLAKLGWKLDGYVGADPTFAVLIRQRSTHDDCPRTWKQIVKRPRF